MMRGLRCLTAVMCLVLGGSAVNTVAEQQAPTFAFTGFFDPIANSPTVNAVKAGAAVPVRFSLGGDRGLNIFPADYPHVRWVECEADKPILALWDETVTAADNSLTYDPVSTRYTYVWKTDKTWVGLCGELQLKLTDGEVYRARFRFRK
jgi:hypothetical protein